QAFDFFARCDVGNDGPSVGEAEIVERFGNQRVWRNRNDQRTVFGDDGWAHPVMQQVVARHAALERHPPGLIPTSDTEPPRSLAAAQRSTEANAPDATGAHARSARREE